MKLKLLLHLLRFLLTAAMLAWLTTQVDLGNVARVIAEANIVLLITAVCIYLLSIICAAWRWQQLLEGMGIRFPLLGLLRLVLTGAFFNMFLPSSVGGDLMKMVLIAPDLERREAAISSVLMDRVVGLAVTIGVGLVAVLLLPSVWNDVGLLATLGIALLGFSLGAVALFSRRLFDLAGRLAPGFIWRRLGPTALRVHESLLHVSQRPDVLLKAAGISVLRQLSICVAAFFAGMSFGLPLGPITYFATVPIAMAITALPVAINGLGLQDNALIFLLGFVGITSVQALSLSIYLHAMRNGIGLLGGVIFALNRGRGSGAPLPVPEPTAEQAAKANLP